MFLFGLFVGFVLGVVGILVFCSLVNVIVEQELKKQKSGKSNG